MNKQWTLHIEKLAKIETADVRLSPLMCFVGDNNSGKSYLMSLLWGILTLGKDIFPKSPSDAKSYKKCENWLRENKCKNVNISNDTIDDYIQWFNDLLAANKKTLLRRIFNYDIDAGKIEIRNYHREKKLELHWEPEGQRYSSGAEYVKFPIQEDFTRDQLLRMNAYLCWNILMEGIAAPLFTPVVKGRRMGEPVYLPASRTGFMLTYSQLVENSLQVSFSPEFDGNTSSLTLPYVDFLQLITKFDVKGNLKATARWAADYIETEMLMGKVVVKKETLPVIQYKPDGVETAIPLYVSSSIITEVSPILLLFKSNIDFKSIIIEEPEAHLHPGLQQQMARLLINLVNRGTPVWITTHSDTILQHINNMIMLKNNPNAKELSAPYGYISDDLLDEKEVTMYQFDPAKREKTILRELSATKYGFEVPTFNAVLEKITNEVYNFQEE